MRSNTSGQLALLATSLFYGGSLHNGSGTVGLQFTTGVGGDQINCQLASTVANFSLGLYVRWDIPDNDSNANAYSLMEIQSGDFSHYVDAALLPQGSSMCWSFEVQGHGDTGCVTVHANTTYWLTEKYIAGSATQLMSVYSGCPSACSLEGSISVAVTGFTNAKFIEFGVTGAEAQSSGSHIWFDNAVMPSDAHFPVLP